MSEPRSAGSAGDGPVDLACAADPVAAFLDAHARGQSVALRTSGSTGRPRSVQRSTASWVHSFPHVAALTNLDHGARVWVPGLSAGPSAATMHLFAAVLTRWAGGTVITSSEAPSVAEGVTHAHLTPLLLRCALDQGVRLDGVEVTVAGDRLEEPLHDRAVAAGVRVSHYYGAAELSFVAWGGHAHALRAFPGVEVEGRPSTEGATELWVRSAYLSSGYVCEPTDVRDASGPLRTDAAGFATVGDRGKVLPDGTVVVAGRGEEGVTTGGATVHVADVEHVIGAAVRGQVAVVPLPHAVLGQVVAAVLTDPTDHARAWAAARGGLAPAQRPRRWFGVAHLPVAESGKLDRPALVALLLAGSCVPLRGAGGAGPGDGQAQR